MNKPLALLFLKSKEPTMITTIEITVNKTTPRVPVSGDPALIPDLLEYTYEGLVH